MDAFPPSTTGATTSTRPPATVNAVTAQQTNNTSSNAATFSTSTPAAGVYPVSESGTTDIASSNMTTISFGGRKDRVKQLNDRCCGALTIGQIRDKADRNTRKVMDRFGHLYIPPTAPVPTTGTSSTTPNTSTKPPSSQECTHEKASPTGAGDASSSCSSDIGAPAVFRTSGAQTNNCLSKVQDLLDDATRTSNVASMPPSWAPWL